MGDCDPAILVIDDDGPLGESIVAMLEMIGYRATWVANLGDALAQLEGDHGFSAILLDLGLGCERGEEIVERSIGREIALPPIVIFSAQPDGEVCGAAKAIAAKGVLLKPCSSQRIKQMLDSVLA